MIKDDLDAYIPYFLQWVDTGGDLDHFPIYMELKGASRKHDSPFKVNSSWLKDLSFNKLVREIWSTQNGSLTLSLSQSFMEKLKKLKHASISSAKEKFVRDKAAIKYIEYELEVLESLEEDGYEMKEKKRKIKTMEGERHRILKENEEKQRLKSRAIWLKAGDEKSFFSRTMPREGKTLIRSGN